MANFLNIQIGQYIPTTESDPTRYRTGYERTTAHRVGMPFAYVAEEDGKVVDINESVHMAKIEYKSGKRVAIEYGELYSRHSSENFYIFQPVKLNELYVNKRIRQGDVLAYNEAFYKQDPYSTQVDQHLGVLATVAFIDGAKTLEDANYISPKLSERLTIQPTMMRGIKLQKSTVVHQSAMVGTQLKSVDPIMIFDEADFGDLNLDTQTAEIMASLNKSIPKAKYTGEVVKIEVYYKCPLSEMSESLAKLVRVVTKEKNAKAKYAEGADNQRKFKPSKPLEFSDKLDGFTLDNDTVYFKFYIRQKLPSTSTDKVVFGAQLKSVSTMISKYPAKTESGRTVDAVMSASSVYKRMVPSAIQHGSMETIMEQIEQTFLDAYDS